VKPRNVLVPTVSCHHDNPTARPVRKLFTVVKSVVNTCIHRRTRKNTKNSKLLILYLLGLLCSSVNGASKFLQNLYSSVRFRSPPPITTSITQQLSGALDLGPITVNCAGIASNCAKALGARQNQYLFECEGRFKTAFGVLRILGF
jgi:hypothetical protein